VGHVAGLIEPGWRVVLTHGNGPQVGFVLRRSEIAIGQVPPIPMDYAGADIQGAVGYMFQKAFRNEFARRRIEGRAAAIVTEVLVDPADPAFAEPTKPIGSHMSEEQAKRLAAGQGWTVREDAGRGWRRVVASPTPREILDLDAVVTLLDRGFTVIACGGGGIPVVRGPDGSLEGVEAVIDKDLASEFLARELGADLFVMATDTDGVYANWGTPEQELLGWVTPEELEQYDFAEGSMGPKVDAAVRFVRSTGHRAAIGCLDDITNIAAGEAGTNVVAALPAGAERPRES
jgi:carbamate kinase